MLQRLIYGSTVLTSKTKMSFSCPTAKATDFFIKFSQAVNKTSHVITADSRVHSDPLGSAWVLDVFPDGTETGGEKQGNPAQARLHTALTEPGLRSGL